MLRQAVPLLLLAAITMKAHSGDWPQWRGPTGQGISDEKDLPLSWGGKDQENVVWKALLPGQEGKAAQDQNQSSPIVVRGKVIVTASYWPGGIDKKEYPEHHVACYQAIDGKRLWDVTIKPGPWKLTDLRGGYTAPTPASDGERVYVAFGSSVLAALDLDGKELWRHQMTPFKFDVALGASPVLHGDTLLLQCDEVERNSFLLALDKKTGAEKWRKKRPDVGFSHSTPVLLRIKDKTQLLAAASGALQGIDPDSGDVLWWCAAQGDTVSPVYGNGLVYLDSGRGSRGVAVDPTGEGDVTKTLRKWQTDQVPQGFSSPVVAGEYLFRLHDPSMVRCTRMATGEVMFKERLEEINTAVSPIVTADGRIYIASGRRSFVLKAGPKLEILGRGHLLDAGSNASPALADGKLFLKGQRYLYCIGRR